MWKYRQIHCIIQLTNKIFIVTIQRLFLPARMKSFGRALRKISRVLIIIAEVAHLVERDLAKVEVAGSSPVFRSKINPDLSGFFF